MSKKVGIPKGLFYHQYYPLWKTFLEALGAEVVCSRDTNRSILNEGVKCCVDEACLPVKVYHGHVLSLKDCVDCLLIPRFTSISKNEYVCPKFGGLPDMIRHTIKDLPTILDVEVNLRKSKQNAVGAALELGSYFCDSRQRTLEAYEEALKEYRIHRKRIKQENSLAETVGNRHQRPLNILLLGHVYNLYDSYVNLNLIQKLKKAGVGILTLDRLDESLFSGKIGCLEKRMFWNFGRKAMGGALHALDREDVDGMIYLMSFGCGVDSFVSDLVERQVRRRRNIPFTVLTLDEHSGEAGLDTRLEAFIDMLQWRRK